MTGLPRSSDLTQSRIACFKDTGTAVEVWDRDSRTWELVTVEEALHGAGKFVQITYPEKSTDLGFGTKCVHGAIGVIGALTAILVGSLIVKGIWLLWVGI